MSRRPHDGQNTTMISLPRDTWSRFVAISTPIFHSEVRWQAIALLALLIGLLLSITGLNILNSYVGRDFMTALAQREASRFAALALRYAGVFAVITVVAVCYRFIEERLGLFWRQWLMQHLLQRFAFLDEAVSALDPEQRRTLYAILSQTAITYISISNDPCSCSSTIACWNSARTAPGRCVLR
jgi:ABC-type uncharacterized transport system fused permease/ATPase subunit